MVYFIVAALVGYLLGSISFAVIFSKRFHGEDIRESGSGNAGATNAIRLYGKKTGAAVFVCDVAKGIVSVFVAKILISVFNAPYETVLVAGFFVQLGHVLPLYHGFRGGKGVATAVGVALALMPLTAVILLALFVAVLFLSKYVAVASGFCAAAYPVLAYFLSSSNATQNCIFAVICSMLILIKHSSNFIRLSRGEEGKIK
ncbi:MAG: glycerol-3-phosphate 1-O-acyltransferase PlsY [Clostridia bacterium]|nr:glycerol-3-phosphate 1-O-acyltransferase PlsY [Clostridia bacterium]